MTKKIIMIGLHPDTLNYAKWPELTPEKLFAILEKDRDTLQKLGYDAQLCYIRSKETAEADVEKALASKPDCVSIGAGVRTDPDYFLLFEKLINVVHQTAPQARICFNTNATDLADAVRCWV